MKPLIFFAAVFLSLAGFAQKQDTIRHANGKTEIVTVIEVPPSSAAPKDTVIPTKHKPFTGLDTNEVFSYCPIPPQFPGGEAAYYEYLRKNSKLPIATDLAADEVYITFIVERNGSITNVKITRDVKNGDAKNKEALRLISAMPAWTPGKLNDTTIVRASLTMPVKFQKN